ncbi:ATP-binding protein [Neolewinella lacunae]|uniref:ATP-binding protein n=1 Tax=Neolewinella lacunae TaxID=1517758 RepID=A0A923PIT8_9BACT|nr:ATP-binding protein [Neolewinella lacunae]MBC6994928.1 ATP-binding protein [Neolewinella lacunae]MDN3633493.1 ATP-binding protein [Neolewinella lacunae]
MKRPNLTIRITGPESSGKSTLARDLAWALDGVYVAEAARGYLLARQGRYTAADLPRIWEVQRRSEDAARAHSPGLVVCDTGPEVIRIWAEVKYGQCPKELRQAQLERHYDLTLLCAPDLPWEPDPLREAPDQATRLALFARYRELLPEAHVISGEERLERAVGLVLGG